MTTMIAPLEVILLSTRLISYQAYLSQFKMKVNILFYVFSFKVFLVLILNFKIFYFIEVRTILVKKKIHQLVLLT